MAVTINADTVTGAAIVTADASGELALQAAGNTGLTLNSSRAIGVGASPSFGTSGQALLSAGSGAAPAWGDVQAPLVSGTNIKTINGGSVLGSGDLAVGGGSMVFLSSVTASNSATVELTGLNSTYDTYVVIGSGIVAVTDSVRFGMRFQEAGVYQSSDYIFGGFTARSSTSTFAEGSGSGQNSMRFTSNVTNASNLPLSFIVEINRPSATTIRKACTYRAMFSEPTGAPDGLTGSFGGGNRISTAAVTGLQFLFVSGNISTGTFRLYGIKNS